MFIGHFAIGLGAKKFAPRISLGTLFMAVQFLDLLWPTLVLAGFETVTIAPGITKMTPLNFEHYPISHSLLMACIWGVVFGAIYFLFKRRFREAVVLFLCVISHWVLDLIVHRPDLPLYFGNSPFLGLGLWNHPVFEILIEGGILIGGTALYFQSSAAKDNIGKYGLWTLVLFLILIQVGNLFGPPPTSVSDIAWAGELQWLFVIWAYWADSHRTAGIANIQQG